MLRTSPMKNWTRGVLMTFAVLGAACLATSAQATTIGFNPTGGGTGGTVNPGTEQIAQISQSAGNAIAVGFNTPNGGGFLQPAVGSTFTLDYQAKVDSLKDSNNNPVFTYTTGGNTGQLTVVASFQEVVTSISPTAATFQTTGVGTVTIFFNPTFAANDSTGLNFAPGTTGNTLSNASFTQVYTGAILANFNGNFSVNGSLPVVNLDPLAPVSGVNTVQGAGGTVFNAQTTSENSAFFVSAPPASLLISIFNTSNNLPFGSAAPTPLFFNNVPGYTSVGSINGGTTADSLGSNPVNAGTPLAANVMFMSTANETFLTVPEPSSVTMAVTGIGFAFLAALRAHRRKNKATAV